MRLFFCDLQEWEWIERRFDPRRALGIPRSIAALIGPDPRVIAEGYRTRFRKFLARIKRGCTENSGG